MKEFSLREKKKALLRNALMEEMLLLLNSKELAEISVEELCERANTSKVTFFKYFSYKEQLLDYYICKWQYHQSYEIHCGNCHGAEGLRKVFQAVSDNPLGQKIMISLIHYYSKLTEKPPVLELSPCEYFLFHEKAYQEQVAPLNLGDIFLHYLSEIEDIDSKDYKQMVQQLGALMYGVPIQNHITGQRDMASLYEAGIRRILGEETAG